MKKHGTGKTGKAIEAGKEVLPAKAQSSVESIWNLPKHRIKESFNALLGSIGTTAAAKMIGLLTIAASAIGIGMPAVWVTVIAVILSGFILYNRKDISRLSKVSQKMQKFRKISITGKTPEQEKALDALNPNLSEFEDKSIKESEKEVSKLYDARRASIGVNIREIEDFRKGDTLSPDLKALMQKNSEFLRDLFAVLDKVIKNKGSGLSDIFTSAEIKLIQSILNKIEVIDGEAQIKQSAELFENVGFEYNSELCEHADDTMVKIKQYLHGKADTKFKTMLFQDDEFSVSREGILNLMVRAVNQNIVCQSVIDGNLKDKILHREKITEDKALLDRAEKLQQVLSPKYKGDDRCGDIAKVIYGVPILSNAEYIDLLVLFDVATAGGIQQLVKSEDDLNFDFENGSPKKVIDIINAYSNDISLAEALNIVRKGSEYVNPSKTS